MKKIIWRKKLLKKKLSNKKNFDKKIISQKKLDGKNYRERYVTRLVTRNVTCHITRHVTCHTETPPQHHHLRHLAQLAGLVQCGVGEIVTEKGRILCILCIDNIGYISWSNKCIYDILRNRRPHKTFYISGSI